MKFEYSADVTGMSDVDDLNELVQKKTVEIIESTAQTVMAYGGK